MSGPHCTRSRPTSNMENWFDYNSKWNEKQINCRDGLPWWLSGKESSYQCRRCGFDPWVGKIPWRRKWQPTPVFLPGKSLGQRSLRGYSQGVEKSQKCKGVQRSQTWQTAIETYIRTVSNLSPSFLARRQRGLLVPFVSSACTQGQARPGSNYSLSVDWMEWDNWPSVVYTGNTYIT